MKGWAELLKELLEQAPETEFGRGHRETMEELQGSEIIGIHIIDPHTPFILQNLQINPGMTDEEILRQMDYLVEVSYALLEMETATIH